jgi:TetR/AcrR family transcriptional repressor of nem operon
MAKGIDTREMIIEKSAELFNVYGYYGCSLSDIMRETGLQKGGIYNHFKNKDEIALASFDYSFGKVLRRFRERLDNDTTSLEKLHSIIAVFESFVHNPVVRGGCPIGNTAIDATDSHPELTKKAIVAINTLQNYVTIKIKEGIASGEFKKEVAADQVSVLLVTSLEGALMMSRVNKDDKYMKTTMKFLKNYIEEHMLNR